MIAAEFWNEPVAADMLAPPDEPLDGPQIDVLWALFAGIPVHWKLDFEVDLLRSRWLDMMEARSCGTPDYRGEYHNAARVFDALRTLPHDEAEALTLIYGETRVKKVAEATSLLRHLKFYVANDFIRCFVATGGFRGFVPKARNYTGFLGGSRYREWDPVRTGDTK